MALLWAVSLWPRATAPVQTETPAEQLSRIRLDKTRIYSIRDISLNRDVFSISFNRGTIAFTEEIDGKVTGAVFMGSGDILAVPPDRIEKQQLFRYTKSALLNEHFEAAVFRFTDGTYEEILKQYRGHAQEEVDSADAESILRWDAEVQRRAEFLNDRILADLIGVRTHPFFLAQIEGKDLGWFDAIYDERRPEEVFVQQNTALSDTPLVWMSFNKRSEVRDPAAVAHEEKSLFDIVSASADGTVLHLRFNADGERVLQVPPAMGITAVTLDDGTALSFHEKPGALTIILPEATKSGTELKVHIQYAAEGAVPIRVVVNSEGVAPASYRDQWIIDGLANYVPAMGDTAVLEQARELLLAQSPEQTSYDSLGPVTIGFRMTQPGTTAGYLGALKSKSIWIMHMLRNLMEQDNPDSAFARFLEDVATQFKGKVISTYDLKQVAEKHAGKPLDWFFDDWVFGTGIPAYRLDYKVNPSGDAFVVSGSITQSGVPDAFEAPVPLYADDTFLGTVPVSSAGGEFRFVSHTRPQQVLIDPKETMLRAR